MAVATQRIQYRFVDVTDRPAASKRHITLDFLFQKLDGAKHTFPPTHRRGIGKGTANEHELCAKRECFDYVSASAHSAIQHDRDTGTSCDDAGKHPQRSCGAVQLTAPVVGNDDAVRSAGGRHRRIARIQKSLDD